MPKKYYLYLARCNDNSLYTGITSDLEKREKRHNQGMGCRYTKQRRPIKIIYSEAFNSLQEASKRERQIKGWIKIKKENLIKGKHPNSNKKL